MNETSAKEWLRKSWHNYSSAKLLFDAGHFTDVIAVEVHYSIEKALKSFIAYENERIPRIHDLNQLYEILDGKVILNEKDLDILDIASQYHLEESYPMIQSSLPDINEIELVLNLAYKIIVESCRILGIKEAELK